MNRYAPKPQPSGAVLQSGLPFAPSPGLSAHGLLVRGVVVATYVYDDPQHPFANDQPAAIYCDVLTYTQLTGGRTYLIKSVLVSQEYASMQGGHIYHPRAATQTISGAPLDPTEVIDPTQLDGDHVLVGFIDDRRHQPVILRMLPPPNCDIGHEDDPVGLRTKLVLTDGDPLLWKSHSSYFGIQDDGSWMVDCSQANEGGIDADGHEIPAAGGGGVTHRAKLAAGAHLELVDPATGQTAIGQTLSTSGFAVNFGTLPGAVSILGAQGPVLAIPAAVSSAAAVQIGAGTAKLVDGASMSSFLAGLETWMATHTHPFPATSTNPTGPSIQPPPVVPSTIVNQTVQVPGP